jgi:hypothetical protein
VLGRDIGCQERGAHAPGRRADHDDAPGQTDPPAVDPERRQKRLGDAPGADHIHRHLPFHLGGGNPAGRAGDGDAGIVHQAGETLIAEVIRNPLHGRLDGCIVGDVEFQSHEVRTEAHGDAAADIRITNAAVDAIAA